MSELAKRIQAAAVLSGGLRTAKTNAPGQYADRQRQYFMPETRRFQRNAARMASDFFRARVQGVFGGPQEWTECGIRLANVVRPSSAIQRNFDDYKQYLFASERVCYVRPGTKIEAMGSTWLVVNPDNISGSGSTGICRRCNTTWRFLDYYGNVVSEPIIKENLRANASDSDAQSSLLVTKGYFNILCQYNDATRQIGTNTRLILGDGAYRVTGPSEVEAEFTDDDGSVRLLGFTARYEEPNPEIDDLVNRVAGGKTFSWDVSVVGKRSLRAGETAVFRAESQRCGEAQRTVSFAGNVFHAPSDWRVDGDVIIVGMGDRFSDDVLEVRANRADFRWESSDETVATVDETGAVTALGAGQTTITATLAQNPRWSDSAVLTVDAADGLFFTAGPPESLRAYESVTLSAAAYTGGTVREGALIWRFSGAAPGSYAANVAENGKSAELTCYGFSPRPLIVTVSDGEREVVAEIRLEGI